MAFVQRRFFRVTEACNCCWPSAMSFPGDLVRRFNPQILDLNRSGHWPLTSRPDWGRRKGLHVCSQKTRGDRVMDSGALLFCCPECCRNWPKDLQRWASVALPHLSFPPHHQTRKPHWPHTHTVQVSFMYHPCFLLVVGITLSSVLVLWSMVNYYTENRVLVRINLLWMFSEVQIWDHT